MAKPDQFLGEGPLTLLGSMAGRLGLEMPDFDTAEEWEEWFDRLCDEHIVQSGKYGWEIVEDKEKFMKNMGYVVDEEEDDPDAENPYEQYFMSLL